MLLVTQSDVEEMTMQSFLDIIIIFHFRLQKLVNTTLAHSESEIKVPYLPFFISSGYQSTVYRHIFV